MPANGVPREPIHGASQKKPIELSWGVPGPQSANGGNLPPRATLSPKAAGSFALSRSERRELYLRQLGVEGGRVHYLNQVHSRTVRAVRPGEAGCFDVDPDALPEADGLIAGDRDAVLCVTVADCLPIFLYDGRTGSFGLLHSGWKGTGIATEAVGLMSREYGCRGEDMWALLGPCIGSCCYRVPEDRYRLFRERYGPEAAVQRTEGFFLDLQATNRSLLAAQGITHIATVNECTCCSPRLASFRREGPQAFGLMLAVVGYY